MFAGDDPRLRRLAPRTAYSRCRGTSAARLALSVRASENGYCIVYAGKLDMRELGRKGGSRSPLTKLRKAADDDLREQARDVLARALAGEDVPKAALDSARSLYAFRPEAPPARPERRRVRRRVAAERQAAGVVG